MTLREREQLYNVEEDPVFFPLRYLAYLEPSPSTTEASIAST